MKRSNAIRGVVVARIFGVWLRPSVLMGADDPKQTVDAKG